MDRVASHDFVPAISAAHRLIPKRLHRERPDLETITLFESLATE